VTADEPSRPLAQAPAPSGLAAKTNPIVDLALTLPIFLGYHLGVVFLSVKNASDVVTGLILDAAAGSKGLYLLFTLAIGVVFAGIFVWLGRGQAFRPAKFAQMAIEGVVYALALRLLGAYVVGSIFGGKIAMGGFTGIVMSLGAGFYEEITYRVLLFGLGAKLLTKLFVRPTPGALPNQEPGLLASTKAAAITIAWAVVAAAVFSGVHYVGALGDPFELKTFVFRWVLGFALTMIFVLRGFAPAVWAHAFYDIWVLVL
jgi:hypothetical protein